MGFRKTALLEAAKLTASSNNTKIISTSWSFDNFKIYQTLLEAMFKQCY